jgi:hypothetical protein
VEAAWTAARHNTSPNGGGAVGWWRGGGADGGVGLTASSGSTLSSEGKKGTPVHG